MKKFTELHKDVHTSLNEEQNDIYRKRNLQRLEELMKEENITNFDVLDDSQLIDFIRKV